MDWIKVSVVSALLLLAPGCALEQGEPPPSPSAAAPRAGALDHGSAQTQAGAQAGEGDVSLTGDGKPQPDPWNNVAAPDGKPQPDPWKQPIDQQNTSPTNGGGKPQPDPWNLNKNSQKVEGTAG